MLQRPGSVLARETLAVTVATELVRRHSGERLRELRIAPEGHAIERVKAYLQSRLDGFVRLGALCALTGLRPYTLVRAFTNRVGMPPGAYHLQLRVNRAKQLLRQGEPLSFVAAATGFTDQSHLTRHFRRITGVTPGAYAATFLP
jgi:transcriptional regulator GlxA family with amidase domain